jgi:hypothetical protein
MGAKCQDGVLRKGTGPGVWEQGGQRESRVGRSQEGLLFGEEVAGSAEPEEHQRGTVFVAC